jgi:hypothetical protein
MVLEWGAAYQGSVAAVRPTWAMTKHKQIGAIAAAKNADLVLIKPCPI